MVVGSVMMNLHSILCKVNANSNNLHVLFKTAQFLSVSVYRLLTMTTFLEVTVYSIYITIKRFPNIIF